MSLSINKTKLIGYLIPLILGLIAGYFLFDKKSEPVASTTNTVTVIKTDTVLVEKEIYVRVPAKIISSTLPDEHSNQQGGALPGPAELKEEVAYWDTITNDGFTARIKYFTKRKMFENYFKIPERMVTTEVTSTTDNTKNFVEYRLPAWQLGVGVKNYVEESSFYSTPFLSLAANEKLWFMNFTAELKALTQFKESIKIDPELEIKISVNL